MNKKILITGGAGFIGLHLANRLISEGYKVDIVDNFFRAVDDDELKQFLSIKEANFIKVNLLNVDEINNLGNDYNIIFHLAAIIGVVHVLNNSYNVLNDNVQMISNIIEFAHKQKHLERFFFSSTSEVYSGTLRYFDLPIPTPETVPLAVNDLTEPRTSYMLSKIYGEALCQQADIPFTIFRPHNVYGPRMGMAHVIPEQLKKMHNINNEESVQVFSVTHTRCFCYIDDAIEMILLMMKSKNCEGKTLNLGTQDPEVSIEELIKICFKVVGKKINIDVQPDSPGSPIRRGPDMRQTYDLIKYKSKTNLSNGVSKTYSWYKDNVFDTDTVFAK